MAKRNLHRPGSSRPQAATLSCLSCSWRQFSNKSLKELHAQNADVPLDYTGTLVGFMHGSAVVVQYQKGKQIGFVSVPLPSVEWLIGELQTTHDREMERFMAAIDAEAEALASGDAEASEADSTASSVPLDEEDDPLAELRVLVAEEEDEDE